MYQVKEKFKNCTVSCNKFTVSLASATQEQLEHLYHIGHIGIEYTAPKKPKNKPIDNFEDNSTLDTNE